MLDVVEELRQGDAVPSEGRVLGGGGDAGEERGEVRCNAGFPVDEGVLDVEGEVVVVG